MDKLSGDYMVQPVVKALQVLEYVARQGHMVSLTEIAQALNLPKTTVFRYLQTLSATSFLEHDIYRDRYGVGCKFRDLAKVDHDLRGLRDVALPEMRQLMTTFNETINLAVLADSRIVYIDMLDPLRPLRATARVGHRHPAHSTALGKAIMAYLPEDQIQHLREEPLAEMTIKTTIDTSTLRLQIADVQRRGYAVEVGENEDGLMCIGVPILNAAGYPVAAMSLSLPERRMRPDLMVVAANALKGAAGRISRQLSGTIDKA